MSLMKTLRQLCFLVVVLAAGMLSAQTTQIDWGTNIFGDEIYTSDGGEVTIDEFTVELGSFANGFVPTAENTSQWVSNWRVFDAVTEVDSDTNDFYLGGPGHAVRFAGNASLSDAGLSLSEDASVGYNFGTDQQAYVFIRNSDDAVFGSEWLLYTSEAGVDWEFPSAASGEKGANLDFDLGEVDQVVFGQANGFVGGGERDFVAATGLQTFTFVPEPSTLGYLLVLLSLMMRDRRR